LCTSNLGPPLIRIFVHKSCVYEVPIAASVDNLGLPSYNRT